MIKIAPSILSADFAALGQAAADIERWRADLIHIDIMDGHFVPNITFGTQMVKAIRPYTGLPLDVHLMVENAQGFIEDLIAAGAYALSVHVEACIHLERVLHSVKSAGIRAGVAINPATSLEMIHEVLPIVDQVLVMSVNPGFSGQRFIPSVMDKIRALRRLTACDIVVDGGITLDNAIDVAAAGADVLIAGASIFSADDPAAVIQQMREIQ